MNHTRSYYKLQQPGSHEVYTVYGKPSWEQEFGNAKWADGMESEIIRCPVYPGHQRGGKRISNLVILLPHDKVADFVWTWYSDCLITEKVLRLFQEANLTGFTVKPVTVKSKTQKNKKRMEAPVLWELVVTGTGGDADPRSGIKLIYTCPHCNLIVYSSYRNGIIVDERAWDGSDFFTITGYRHILVSERVKELVIKNGLTNCALIPSQDLEWGALARPEDRYGKKE